MWIRSGRARTCGRPLPPTGPREALRCLHAVEVKSPVEARGITSTPALAAAMARATADANSRRDAHNQFIRNLAAEIPQFTATHSAQIAEAEARWQAISREADKARATWYKAHPELPRL